jgi:hypothetical protein
VVDGVASDLFGAHVADFALEGSGFGHGALGGGFCDAEVADLHVPGVGDQHVGGADVAVDQAQRAAIGVGGFVGVVEAFERLGQDEQGELEGELELLLGAAGQHVQEVFPLHKLHADEVLAFDLAQVVDLHDVAVDEAHHDLGLVDEHLDELFVVGEVRQDLFDRKLFLKPVRAVHLRAEDLGHTAAADAIEQGVLSELDRALLALVSVAHALVPGAGGSRRGVIGTEPSRFRPCRHNDCPPIRLGFWSSALDWLASSVKMAVVPVFERAARLN